MSILDECWEWKGARISTGYGWKWYRGAPWLAHRIAWAWANGPIPKGMHVLHRCDNPPCCNPGHLFVGSRADNMKDMERKGRGSSSKKTHCPHGHEYANDNVYLWHGKRSCRTCVLAYHKRRRARARQERLA